MTFITTLPCWRRRRPTCSPRDCTPALNSRVIGPELAEDGSDTTRWVSYGDKPGMGPTPEKPEFLQFNCDDPRPATGVYLKAYPHCSPKEVEVQCSDDGQTFRSLKRVTMEPGQDMTIPFDEVQAKHFRILFLSAHPFRGAESWNVQVAEVRLMPKRRIERGRSGPAGNVGSQTRGGSWRMYG